MPVVKKGKLFVGLYISGKVIERIKEIVKLKYPGMYGLSHEVEIALKQYIASYTQQQRTQKTILLSEEEGEDEQTIIKKSNPYPKVYQLKQDISRYLVDSLGYVEVPQNILDKHLTAAIAAIKGTDTRTIKKWTDLLKKCGCIKVSGIHQYEFV